MINHSNASYTSTCSIPEERSENTGIYKISRILVPDFSPGMINHLIIKVIDFDKKKGNI